MIEKFIRVDSNNLRREITFDDPKTWTRPWTVLIEMGKTDDHRHMIFDSACHEGNYGLTDMLANTRVAEKLFKDGKGPDPRTMDLATGGGVDPADQKYSFGRAGSE